MYVLDAKYKKDYKVVVWFNISPDNPKELDIEPVLRDSENPDIRELLDPKKFKQFHVEHGGLCWDNNALSFSAQSLYYGDYHEMPNIYKYFGIVIYFGSKEHNPIHVHAEYNGAIVKISFTMKEGKITRTTYEKDTGEFPPAKLKDLKAFVKTFKYKIVDAWCDYFVRHITPKCTNITIKV